MTTPDQPTELRENLSDLLELQHVNCGDDGSCSHYDQEQKKIESFISLYESEASARSRTDQRELLKEVLRLIPDEIAIAHSEDQPTSRLTSLYNKISELLARFEGEGK